MASTVVTNTYTSNTSINIPSDAGNVTVAIVGARGARGGNDASQPGGNRGDGRTGTFILSNFTARDLTFSIGAAPTTNGPSNCANCRGIFGIGLVNGGFGGRSGGSGSSGGGGGGGGATGVYDSVANKWIIVAGGGGGGGGASHPRLPGFEGNDGSSWNTGLIDSLIGAGLNGVTQGGDGGGGGGGGGGAGGGAGGNSGRDHPPPGFNTGGRNAEGGMGGTSRYDSSYATLVNGSSSLNTSEASPNGSVGVSYTLYTPEIVSFIANPNPQNSGNAGVPQDTTTLQWNCKDGNLLEIYKLDPLPSLIYTDSTSSIFEQTTGTLNVDTNLQSVAGTNSPATITYTLKFYAGNVSTTQNLTISVRNDNTPNDFNLPSTTTSGVNINNLEPNTQYQIQSPPITGIDMITSVVTTSAGLEVSTNGSNWSSVAYISNSQTFFLRFTSQPFNSDPNGAINSRTYNYTVGTLSKSFTISTRAPDISEIFDFGDSSVNYPYPDIDQITNTPSQYMTSPTVVVMGDSGTPPDAEIPVEIKVNNPNVQIRIKPQGSAVFGNWQTPRST